MIWDELKDITFSVVDLETTGFSFEKDEILEICVVHINNGNINNVWDSLVRPKKRVRLELTEIHDYKYKSKKLRKNEIMNK